MSYTDFYLAFPDKATADSVLYTDTPIAWDNTDPENPVVTETELRPNFRNLDVLPLVQEQEGQYDIETGEELVAPIYSPLYHANVRALPGEDTSALEAYAVTPNTPARVWA